MMQRRSVTGTIDGVLWAWAATTASFSSRMLIHIIHSICARYTHTCTHKNIAIVVVAIKYYSTMRDTPATLFAPRSSASRQAPKARSVSAPQTRTGVHTAASLRAPAPCHRLPSRVATISCRRSWPWSTSRPASYPSPVHLHLVSDDTTKT